MPFLWIRVDVIFLDWLGRRRSGATTTARRRPPRHSLLGQRRPAPPRAGSCRPHRGVHGSWWRKETPRSGGPWWCCRRHGDGWRGTWKGLRRRRHLSLRPVRHPIPRLGLRQMENHRTNFRENLNRHLKKTIWRRVERIWCRVERIWREGEIAAGESALGENRGRREKAGEAHGIEKEEKGPTNSLRNRRVQRLIGSAASFLALALGASCDAKLVLSPLFSFIHLGFC